jgi:hypothetical protein
MRLPVPEYSKQRSELKAVNPEHWREKMSQFHEEFDVYRAVSYGRKVSLEEALSLFLKPSPAFSKDRPIHELVEMLEDPQKLLKVIETHSRGARADDPFVSTSYSRSEAMFVALQYSGKGNSLVTVQTRPPKYGAFDVGVLRAVARGAGIPYRPVFHEAELQLFNGMDPDSILAVSTGHYHLRRSPDQPNRVDVFVEGDPEGRIVQTCIMDSRSGSVRFLCK